MTDQTPNQTPAKTGFTIPPTVLTGVLIAVVVGVTYVFFGPDAAKTVCNAVM